ncbi:hypothetical protein J1C56_01365 [Aminobacter anthyllidis]|uniref:Uncharacterized protein n=1 Tax=Aminobacter anthyllidis TaxID=1035067 RepID=A0A9X1D410_9HYPH|nr:hypothetical protein [Aminobacter anthyllidis]MBT1154234.1 hypothetical protein [Aminobacter anthyllidis]
MALSEVAAGGSEPSSRLIIAEEVGGAMKARHFFAPAAWVWLKILYPQPEKELGAL